MIICFKVFHFNLATNTVSKKTTNFINMMSYIVRRNISVLYYLLVCFGPGNQTGPNWHQQGESKNSRYFNPVVLGTLKTNKTPWGVPGASL